MNKLLALAVAAATAASADAFAAESTCTAAPSCASLGYTDTTRRCPGEYTACPFDTTQVKCILEARAGDLKYSLQTSNHNGWLLCNGSSYSTSQYAELYNVLRSSFGSRLPNYSGSFLKAASGVSGSSLTTMQAAGLPNITGKAMLLGPNRASSWGENSLYIVDSGMNWGDGSGKGTKSAGIVLDASRSSTIYGKSTTVTPQNYSANVFIYSGRYY